MTSRLKGLLPWASRQQYDVDDPSFRDEALIARIAERLGPLLHSYFRLQVDGLQHVPAGPCLFVGNHNGGMLMPDMFLLGLLLYERYGIEAVPWGMAHRLGMRVPLLRTALLRLGGIRGTQTNGLRLLAEGRKVVVYPGGELDSMRSYRERHRVCFGPRRGYVKLALRARVPVVPVVTAGAHETLIVLNDGRWLAERLGLERHLGLCAFPLSFSLPWGFWLGVPPPHFPLPTQIKVALLPPMHLDPSGDEAAEDAGHIEACHREIHQRMERTLYRLSHQP